jgi:hypothetical protein
MLTIRQRQTRNSPVIVGGHYELAETVAAIYTGELFGGLLAKPHETTALLSMSGYEKSQNAGLNSTSILFIRCPIFKILLPWQHFP